MKRVFIMLAIAAALAALIAAQSLAGEGVEVEYEILLDELVNEGILTPEKAKIIKDKMATAKEKAEKERATEEKAAKEVTVFELPKELAWLSRLKFSGDLRLRYQMNKEENVAHRHRGRYRFRLGVKADVTDDIFVAAGLATGGADPRTTNQTMDNTFGTPDIRFDYGYAQYEPLPWLTVKGGRLKGMPFWKPADLLWEDSINPNGGAIQLDYTFLENSVTVDGFFNTAFFILDEWRTETDPFMYVFQPGVNVALRDFGFKTAVTYYGFEHIKRQFLDWSSGTNTTIPDVGLMYDYDSIGVGAELGYTKPFGMSFIPYTGLFGEYIHNFDPSDDNDGFLVGLKVGHKKVSDKGSWQAHYTYRHLERDAWLDTFPPCTLETNIRGHQWKFKYGLFKHVILGVDYYYMQPIEGHPRPYEHAFKYDTIFQF